MQQNIKTGSPILNHFFICLDSPDFEMPPFYWKIQNIHPDNTVIFLPPLDNETSPQIWRERFT